MHFSFYPYQLKFRFPFAIAHGTRTHTEVVYLKVEYQGLTGWGEAALPPYLNETPHTVMQFLNRYSLAIAAMSLDEALALVQQTAEKNYPAMAALDMALWDIKLLQNGTSLHVGSSEILNKPLNTYTIGVCNAKEMNLKVDEALANGFKLFKLKLNGMYDERMVNDFRLITSLPFAVDANQSWADVSVAKEKAHWLNENGCIFIEQPFAQEELEKSAVLTQENILPVYADESCQTISDLGNLKDTFSGINIKLMKCGGITPALEMITKARQLNLKILLGCMSESTVGCRAAAHLAPLVDYTDLDGPFLISNDCFIGLKMENGSVKTDKLQQINNLRAS